MLAWLQQEGREAPKHQTYTHSIATFCIHFSIVIPSIFLAHDVLISSDNEDDECATGPLEQRRHTAAVGVLLYGVFLMGWRLFAIPQERKWLFYEFTWLCNNTLIVGSLGLYFDRPIIAGAFCITVGIDQLLWYIDLSGWCLTGFQKFPIGVAKYITWPGTTWATRITCTHHVWTIPLYLWASGSGGLHWKAFPLSSLSMFLAVGISRFLTPKTIMTGKDKPDKYLNVNLSHELWKDISFSLLQINYDDPSPLTYLFRLSWRWQGFNLLVFIFLHYSSVAVLGEPRIC